jgi:hypothetical protein
MLESFLELAPFENHRCSRAGFKLYPSPRNRASDETSPTYPVTTVVLDPFFKLFSDEELE